MEKTYQNKFHNFLQKYINKRVIDLFSDPDAIYLMGVNGGSVVQQTLTDAPTIAFDLNLGSYGVLNTMAANRNIQFTNLRTPSFVMLRVIHTTQNTSIALPGTLASNFAWSTNLNGVTLVSGAYDGTQWLWTSNTF
jgi:hypothetical protein